MWAWMAVAMAEPRIELCDATGCAAWKLAPTEVRVTGLPEGHLYLAAVSARGYCTLASPRGGASPRVSGGAVTFPVGTSMEWRSTWVSIDAVVLAFDLPDIDRDALCEATETRVSLDGLLAKYREPGRTWGQVFAAYRADPLQRLRHRGDQTFVAPPPPPPDFGPYLAVATTAEVARARTVRPP